MRKDNSLGKKLKEYAESDTYPYHMPGHKGSADTGSAFDSLHGMDITEIYGFDDLHHATGILKRLQENAAEVFGADRTFYLVGGSTVGILAAVSAALPYGSELLIARNCHKSVYHAAYLRGLRLHYILPEIDPQAQILKPVTAAQVREALRQYPGVGAVLITSPTYEGLAANVEEIAKAVHERNIPLIVDEAHGAHFGFASYLPPNSNTWADLVVQSLHKTTKALTQTALLHANGNRVPAARVQKYLDVYMTSSPSYLLMASMEEAIRDLQDNGERLYRDFMYKKEAFWEQIAGLKTLFVYEPGDVCTDPCKILICSRRKDFSGKNLYDVLLRKYRLQMELCENNHVLAIMTPYDRQEGFDRLAAALNEIDRELAGWMQLEDVSRGPKGEHPEKGRGQSPGESVLQDEAVRYSDRRPDDTAETGVKISMAALSMHLPRQAKTLSESWGEGHFVPLAECAGKVSAAFVYQYPPGVPLIAPGEVWDEELIREVREKTAIGYEMLGIVENCGTMGAVVTEPEQSGCCT